ncbi:hypothetical protein AVEN_113673-1 [Araneus ventricosus]|uniref:Uncharacterized protein n=1 Tax=Araneus ventricosus TaxID=182803 RepID=A0A4Y2CCU8_ARAVE|nr:hypothetical protein AVEN_239897-1 [Araneus ventricosus]GBM02060.1 hypothetical protein AVEN_261734-1 [Araneus ventricosus]GBM02067.1 hypothetical protein AVEN_26627-1 [Araneus ventricosus]GBM02094.1 hypothetical protein AVEN_113673-1 [Araneus ventricosus]
MQKDLLNEGNTISHSAALQSVETLLDYMGQRGFDYSDITAKKGRGGLVVRSRLRGRRISGSKSDPTENPPSMGLLQAKSYVGGQTSSRWCGKQHPIRLGLPSRE